MSKIDPKHPKYKKIIAYQQRSALRLLDVEKRQREQAVINRRGKRGVAFNSKINK